MKHPDGRAIQENESFIPERLLRGLVDLESASSTREVWDILVRTGAEMALPFVEYTYATDFRNPARPQFVHTTIDSVWLTWIDEIQHLRDTATFRSHGCRYLTPVIVGVSYFDEMGTISPERRQHLMMASQLGVDAAVAFPLRMGIDGQAALMTFGGPHSKADFDDMIARHGWTLHALSHSAHLRYTELLKTEMVTKFGLTEKQRELIGLVGLGMMDKQIAHTLGISFSAVRQRLATVQQKTGAQNRADLAALAMRLGLVPDPLLRGQNSQATVYLSTHAGATENSDLICPESDSTAAE